MDGLKSPFVPDTVVAIRVAAGGFGRAPFGYKRGTVSKVYKSGNFTLEGSPQQWRPLEPSSYEPFWRALQTGNGSHGELRIWDDASDADIAAQIDKYTRYRRFLKIQDAIRRVGFSDLATTEVLDRLEAVAADLRKHHVEEV